jgi:hypothetical protein
MKLIGSIPEAKQTFVPSEKPELYNTTSTFMPRSDIAGCSMRETTNKKPLAQSAVTP